MRILAVTAHPDDETFGCGGTLAKYAAEGNQITLLCATLGEAGEIQDPSLANHQTLGLVREQELRAACRILGINNLLLLGYRDSGMAGTPENDHPDALIGIGHQQIVGRVVEVIRRIKPHLVITFDQTGGYGHPDHIAVHHATLAAFSAAPNISLYPELLGHDLAAYQPHKLYCFVIPRSLVTDYQAYLKENRSRSDLDGLESSTIGTPDHLITAELNVAPYISQKRAAALCHKTQVGTKPGEDPFSWLPDNLRQKFLAREHLIRIYPTPTNEETPETDILSGIRD